jgi:putative transposase
MKTVCEALNVSRANIAARVRAPTGKPLSKPAGRAPAPDEALVSAIKAIIGAMPTYGYRRVWAILRRAALKERRPPANHKRVYRVMKVHGLLLQRHAGGADQRRHDGTIAVDRSNLRWCSDGFELGCDNGEKVRIAFALDCCDREAMGYVEHRFGQVNRSPRIIEWLTDNGSAYTAHETRSFARDIGLEPRTTPVTSPQSNGMAEAFVRTIKRDYARVNPMPDAKTVIESLPMWFDHYNNVHPHSALRYRAPNEFIADQSNQEAVSGF